MGARRAGALRQLRHHPAWRPTDLATDLAAARDRLTLMHAENLSVVAAFGLSYQDLAPGPQRLFRRLGVVAGPSIDGCAAAALDGVSLDEAARHLGELYDQHLLTEPAHGRYQLHDLLREHARTLADADEAAETDAATGRLLDYYLHTALTADRHIPTWDTAHRRQPVVQRPRDAPDLSSLRQAAAWLDAERPNLHAAVVYAAASGRHLHVVQIPAAMGGFLRERGHWDQAVALHQTALTTARHAGDQAGEAGMLHELGLMKTITSDYPAAAASLAQAVALYGDIGDRAGQAYALCQQGIVQTLTGDYRAGMASNERALTLAHGCGDQRAEACTLQMLGCTQQLTADYAAAAANLAAALNLYRSLSHRFGEAESLNNLGTLQTLTGDYPAAGANLRQALEIFRDLGNQLGHAEALNRLGELSTRTSATGQARDQHTRALAIIRGLGVAPEEARALEGIGNSHLHDGNHHPAADLKQALAIYQSIGAPAAQRVREARERHQLTFVIAESPTSTPGQSHQPSTPATLSGTQ